MNSASVAFLIFGLAFFIYVIWKAQVWEENHHQRRMAERREFEQHPRSKKSQLNPK